MNPPEESRCNRREMCRDVLRYAALGGIALVSGGLVFGRKQAPGAATCGQAGACGDCGAQATCTLPQFVTWQTERYVWQLDPDKCMTCGQCQTHCVLDVSAVKAVQCFALCGYCDVCTGYFPTRDFVLATGAENQLCPTGAIIREYIEEKSGERFFEYTINESLCIACGKCVAGCKL